MTLDADFTAIIGPNCTPCGNGGYKPAVSIADGYLEYTSNETEAIEVGSVVNYFGYKVYIHGRWGLETISVPKFTNITYGKTDKHRVFIIDKWEYDSGTQNKSYSTNMDGFIGFAKRKESKNQNYIEYLKHKNLITTNTLAIENPVSKWNRFAFDLDFIINRFDKTALAVPFEQKWEIQGSPSIFLVKAQGLAFGEENPYFAFTNDAKLHIDFNNKTNLFITYQKSTADNLIQQMYKVLYEVTNSNVTNYLQPAAVDLRDLRYEKTTFRFKDISCMDLKAALTNVPMFKVVLSGTSR